MENFVKTKPSFLEGGLPAASLSAECQRDNNARQRPPQNRLHIWWARRPPTISRAAILAALLPHDMTVDGSLLPPLVSEPTEADLGALLPKQERLRSFFQSLLSDVPPTALTESHSDFLRALGITGDADRAHRRLAMAEDADDGRTVTLGSTWGYRHPPSLPMTPSPPLIGALLKEAKGLLGGEPDTPITILDFMAGGGVIPLEGVRYGLKVYANDLNPAASLVLKSTLEYPAKFGEGILQSLETVAREIHGRVASRLTSFFPFEPAARWWCEVEIEAKQQFSAKAITKRAPALDRVPIKNTYLWLRTVACPKCSLKIPISTNLHLVTKKGQPERSIAAFPEVPPIGQGNECSFRIVRKSEWTDCRWPRSGFDHWHPRNTPTFKDGKAECPRCGTTVDGEKVKAQGLARQGGLPAQMYAVASKVPVRLTYRNGDVKVRYLWRFRAPMSEDLVAVRAAEEELARRLPQWEAQGLVPDEEIQEGEKTREPRNAGFRFWRDLFLPRQLLTILVILEEIRAAQEQVRADLPKDQAEAVAVYLAFMLDKVVNYNSVNTFWHYGRQTVAQTFSRHDFAFRPAFCEFEGARETMMWAANQVIDAYTALCALIHGGEVDLTGDDEDLDDSEDQASEAESKCDDLETNEEDLDETGTLHMHRAGNGSLRPEVIIPTVTCEDAAAAIPGEPRFNLASTICL